MRRIHAGSRVTRQGFTETSSSCLYSRNAVVRVKEKFQAAEKTRRRQPERNGWTRLKENYNHRFSAPGSTTVFYVFFATLRGYVQRLPRSMARLLGGRSSVIALLLGAQFAFETRQPCSETRIPAPVTASTRGPGDGSRYIASRPGHGANAAEGFAASAWRARALFLHSECTSGSWRRQQSDRVKLMW